MAYVNKVEKDEHDKAVIEQWKKDAGIKSTSDKLTETPKSWTDLVKLILMKPYIYVVACIMFVSPYGADILRMIFDFCAK